MDSAVTAAGLVRAVAQKLTDEYGWQPELRKLPEGLRLEIHPSVQRALYQDADVWTSFTDNDLASKFEVPLRINTELSAGGWRLVIITEDVLTGGTVYER